MIVVGENAYNGRIEGRQELRFAWILGLLVFAFAIDLKTVQTLAGLSIIAPVLLRLPEDS